MSEITPVLSCLAYRGQQRDRHIELNREQQCELAQRVACLGHRYTDRTSLPSQPRVLGAGTYNGQITITASGAQRSPVTVPVSLTVNNMVSSGADWPMVGGDPTRSGFAGNDTTITPSNVANLALQWTTRVDGKVVAQPL